MTSQVLLINPLSVAIASDSVISQRDGENTFKTRDTSEKILPLPNHCIAVMTSGDSELAGYPIESLLWEWSRTLNTPLDTVDHYLNSFLKWLEKLPEMSNVNTQKQMYERLVDNFLNRLWKATADWEVTKRESNDISEEYRDENEVSFSEDSLKDLDSRIDVWVDWVKNLDVLTGLDESWSRGTYFQFADLANERINYWLDDRLISDGNLSKIQNAIQRLAANYVPTYSIGVVFAGFGNKDLLPKCVYTDIFDVLAGRTRHSKVAATGGGYHFFGQWRHSVQFIRGIDSEFQRKAVQKFAHLMIEKFENDERLSFTPQQSEGEETASISDFCHELSREIDDYFEEYAQHNFTDPFMNVIRLSPESDLGRLAHTLIEIEAIRQSINETTPTVGGPIDVAVISKVNGFRWVQHKTLGN